MARFTYQPRMVLIDADVEKLLQDADSMIRDLCNGWPVHELARDPEEWRREVSHLVDLEQAR